ncbi:hypothetical protein ACS0TY_019156 [Phlomoides rotata]
MEMPYHTTDMNQNLGEDEDDLIIGFENLEVNPEDNQLCLVGRFLSEQPINFNLLKNRIASVWRPTKGVNIKNIGEGRLLFQFYHSADLQRVLDGSPWSFGSHPMVLCQLRFGEIPHQVSLNKLCFWVQIHDLPVGTFSEGVGRILGNYIGRFVTYDDTNRGAIWRTYMRIRVEIDVGEPLKTGKKIRICASDATWVKFKYERLYLFCFVCGRLGHTEAYYEPELLANWGHLPRRWGIWIRAMDRRGQSGGGEKWLREDSGNSEGVHAQSPEEGGGTAATSSETFGGVNHGIPSSVEDPKGKSIITVPENSNSNEQLRGFNAIMVNPIYEPPNSMIVQSANDSNMHDDPRKRRRTVFLHETSHIENEQDTAGMDRPLVTSDHFLLVGPDSGVCRGQ